MAALRCKSAGALIVVFTAMLVPAGVAVAQTTTFMPSVSHDWHSVYNWTHGIPNASLHAVIPAGQTCVIDPAQGNALAASIEVQGALVMDGATLNVTQPGAGSQTSAVGPLPFGPVEVIGAVSVLLKSSRRHTAGDDDGHARRVRKAHRRAEGRRR